MDPVKFLIVDDLQENLIALEALLRRDGLQLLHARSGPEALEHLLAHDVALAVLDVQMPGMNGFELAELMRGTERTRRVPIIFLTAGSVDQLRQFRGYESGAVDFLFKPIEPQILRSKADVFFELYRQRQELAAQRDTLRAYKDRLELAMRAGHTGVWDWEIASSRVALSGQSNTILGITDGRFDGTFDAMLALIHVEDQERVRAALQVSIERASDYSEEHRIVRPDGEVRLIKSMGMVRRNAAGQVVSMVGTVMDVSEQRAAQVQLARAKEAAESANAAKDRFLAMLSHELRTPLAPVLVALTLWERHESLPPDLKRDLAMIRRNVDLECRLIDDMLDLNRITLGKLGLKRAQVDLHDEIRHAVLTCSADASAKQIELKTNLGATNHFVDGDAGRIQQILWNLLKNAVKFTPEKGSVDISTADLSSRSVRVSVTDSGIGIEPEKISNIFNAFEQGSAHITRQFGGLGLGLAISKAIADLHGGTLNASSPGIGHGATFTLELPALPDAPKAPDMPRPPSGVPSVSNGRQSILLVEDHEDTASIMQRILEGSGYQISLAGTIEQALTAWADHRFDLLISDLGLPDGSGHDLVRQIRSRGPVAAIALSGYGMEEDVASGANAGFAGHLVKPVDFEQLLQTIDRVLSQSKSKDARLP